MASTSPVSTTPLNLSFLLSAPPTITTSIREKLLSAPLLAKMWFSEMGNRVGNGLKRTIISSSENNSSDSKPRNCIFPEKSKTLGILSFETAKTMSRLVSLHKSLADEEVTKLHKDVVKLESISYLISKDEEYLLKLACKERLTEIDRAASTVARLGKTCQDSDLMQFERVYVDLKLGYIDLSTYFVVKEIEKTMDKMEKFVATTAELYGSLEYLAEMEASEKKLKSWNYKVTVVTQKNQKNQKNQKAQRPPQANFDLFDQKLAWQRNRVKHLRQVSLWGQTYEKTVRLMARAICIVFARMCVVFSPFISIMPRYATKTPGNSKQETNIHWLNQQAGPSTVGGSGLFLRYANLVLTAERYLASRNSVNENGREELYNMLPESLRKLVKRKLKRIIREEEKGLDGDILNAEGWREVSRKILTWLSPMAHATLRWKMERNVEKQSFDAKPKVLLIQTFFFADRVKAEAAIAEVLVGLSCISRYETKRPGVL